MLIAPNRQKGLTHKLPWVVLGCALLVTAWAWRQARHGDQAADRVRFERHVAAVEAGFRNALGNYEQVLLSLESFYAGSMSVERHEWKTFMRNVQSGGQYPGLTGLAFVAHVPQAKLEPFLAQTRGDGAPGFTLRPAGACAHYFPLKYTAPRYEDDPLLGLDVGTVAELSRILEQARDSGKTAVLSAQPLFPCHDGTASVILCLPIYRNGAATGTTAERRAAVEGWVIEQLCVGEIVKALRDSAATDVDFEIYDGADVVPDHLLYDDDDVIHATPTAGNRPLQARREVAAAGGRWTLVFTALPTFHRASAWPVAVGLVGLVSSLLLAWVVWWLTAGRTRALRLAEAMTASLRDSERRVRLDEHRAQVLLRMSQMTECSAQHLARYALEEGLRLTGSQIGYIAFVSEDEKTLTMQHWSKAAMEQCRIMDKPLVYPVEKTGLWGEAVRQRGPVITNDYAAPNPHKKTLPAGHVPIQRHLNVPVFDGCRIVAVAGVGNKPEDYDQGDVNQLSLLMDGLWELLQRQKVEADNARINRALRLRDACHEAILRHTDETALMEGVCRVATETGGYCMAWVGFAEHDANKTVRPAALASASAARQPLEVGVTWGEDERGRGPTGTAIRTGQPVCMRRPEADALLAPWLGSTRKVSCRCFASFPLRAEGNVLGALTCCSGDADAFNDEEMRLLLNLADRLAQALVGLRHRAERDRWTEELTWLASFPSLNPLPLIEVDMSGKVTYANPAAREVWPDLTAQGGQHPVLAGLLEAVAAAPEHERTCFRRECSCKQRVWEQSISCLLERQRIRVYHMEVTHRKQAEAEQRRKLEIETERNHLRDAVKAMDQVLGVVGHELRTPLAGLRAMSELLLTDGLQGTSAGTEFLHSIHGEVIRMADMVNNMLEAARLNSGCAKWNWGDVPLQRACQDALATVRALVDEDLVQLVCDVRPAALTLRGDADAVRRLVVNLAGNAGKHTRRGEIRVAAEPFEQDGRPWVRLIVSDTGSGIPPNIVAKLGEAFALNSGVVGADHVRGSGLGLAICKGIVAAHGGSVQIESIPGTGTRVTVLLRADLQAPAAPDNEPGLVRRTAT